LASLLQSANRVEVPTPCLRPWGEETRSAPPPSRPLRDPPRRCSSSNSSSRRHLHLHRHRYGQHPRQRRSLRSPPPLPEVLFPCFQPLDLLRRRWRARWRRRARWRSAPPRLRGRWCCPGWARSTTTCTGAARSPRCWPRRWRRWRRRRWRRGGGGGPGDRPLLLPRAGRDVLCIA
ncbi:unnamed protein product, partial [Scytosiphon promiscuus]